MDFPAAAHVTTLGALAWTFFVVLPFGLALGYWLAWLQDTEPGWMRRTARKGRLRIREWALDRLEPSRDD